MQSTRIEKHDCASHMVNYDEYLPSCAQASLHVFASQTCSDAEKSHFEMLQSGDFRFVQSRAEIFIYSMSAFHAIKYR